ncbi:carbohydrate binding domain-containing protein [Pseudomonas sp. ZS1P83]
MARDQAEALENTVLVLYAPRLPEATEPVVGAHAGVPLRIYDLTPMGATVEVDPYLNQQPGDTVTLNLNGQPGIDSKQTQAVDDVVTLYIPKKLLLADVINRLTYTVTRGSQNMGTSEPPLELLYNAIRPGDQDTNPGEDGHSRLELLLPDTITNGVGPDFPAAGAQVCVSYPYCRADDLIRLNCNGHDVFHTVTALQAPKPGSDEPVTVCFTVTRADLESAKDHPQFKFSYTVTDQLGNGPDTDSPWSATQIVDVDLAGNRLPAPILREILNDPTDDPGTIDLEKLGNNPLLLIVLTNDLRFQPGDTVNAIYTAKVTGQPDVVVPATGVAEADEFGQKRPCVLQVANDKVIAGSVVQAKYELVRNGVVIATSKTTIAEVSGAGSVDLLPPFLVKPAVSPIDALAYPNGVTVRVEYLGALEGDKARLVEVNAPAGSPQFPLVAFNSNKRTNTVLTQAFLAARQGKEIELRWNLNRNGGQAGKSPAAPFSVLKVADEDPRFPTAVIAGRTGQELDVTELVATDALTITQWPGQEAGQNVWLRYEGVDNNGVAVFYEDLKGEPNNTVPGLIRPAPLDWLNTIKNGSELKILFKVVFDGSADEDMMVSFPIRHYTVKTRVKLSITWDFNDNTLQGWVAHGRYAGGDLNVSSGVAHAFTNGGGDFSGQVMTIAVAVEAGETYDLGFSLAARGAGAYSTKLYLTINGAAIGATVDTQNQVNVWKNGTGIYQATTSGTVTLGIWNLVGRGAGNDFMMDNIWMRER